MKNTIIVLAVIILLGIGGYFLLQTPSDSVEAINERETPETVTEESNTETGEQTEEQAKPGPIEVIGASVEGRDITAYHYGEGNTELLFVGGIHGGYSWNTVLVAYELMDYLEENPSAVPSNVTITIIPVLNPDGLNKIVGSPGRFAEADVPSTRNETIPGRFNSRDVDLNRNFDCDWQTSGTWQSRAVSGGSEVFSEPESQALRNYVGSHNLAAAVVWYSAAGGVFASSCRNGVLPETLTITSIYSDASGYKSYEDFDFYEITGDAVNWLAKQQIPAISVLLTTHEDIEWTKNKAGIEALFEHYAK